VPETTDVDHEPGLVDHPLYAWPLALLGLPQIEKTNPVFWFMMQIAMLASPVIP
jgi:hypothetical protein